MKAAITLLLLVVFFGRNVPAQERGSTRPFVLGVIDSIRSKQLSETRVLNIYLPEGYGDSVGKKYPVVYLLDGSANEDFIHVAGIEQFMDMLQMIQPVIIVGVANVDRRRDFTFPTRNKKDLADFRTTGSSAKFIQFIEKELEPYVQRHYRVTSQRTIVGQSLGGLLATEILLKKPRLFNQYVIVSPSLWWDDESLLAAAPGLLANLPADSFKVYVSVGTEEKQMNDDVDKLVAELRKSPNPKLKLIYAPLPDENHLTILHNSVYKAFLLLFKKD